ncbi:MAG TPA: organomercurial lyase [Gemmatimonadaceae bacterium]|nr:organomercurial lyase [Gemmatimonadaceae bacterium]
MDLDTRVKVAIYQWFAERATAPAAGDVARSVRASEQEAVDAYGRLRAQRVLALEPNGRTIRMAPPFSGVPTKHVAEVSGKRYFANCAWDSLGIVAAFREPGVVHSECAQSHEPLHLSLSRDGPEPCDWVFHCLVPAAKWWDDIVFT